MIGINTNFIFYLFQFGTLEQPQKGSYLFHIWRLQCAPIHFFWCSDELTSFSYQPRCQGNITKEELRSGQVASSATIEPLISNRKQTSSLFFFSWSQPNRTKCFSCIKFPSGLWNFLLAIPCVLSSFPDAPWISSAQLQNQNQENTCHSYWKNNWTVVALSPVSH